MNKYKNIDLSFLDIETCEIIEDENEIIKYINLVEHNKADELPDDIFYEVNEEVYTFYRELEINDDEIDASVKISKARSLKSISNTLKLFKTLTIVLIILIVAFIFIAIIIGLSVS